MKFEQWWHEIGSGLIPTDNEDREEHAMRVAKLAAEAERKECAKVCDTVFDELGKYDGSAADLCGDKIRERSNK